MWVAWAVARFTVGGSCNRPETAENFTKELYLGRWHQMFVGKETPFQDMECVSTTYADNDGTNIRVDNQSMDPATMDFGNNWQNGPPPAGEPKFFFSAHCSEWQPGFCQVKPFWFVPYNDYKVIGFDSDTANGYSIVYGCDTYLGGAYKQDWNWVLTRQALVIGTAAW